jgi:hypothetical protein
LSWWRREGYAQMDEARQDESGGPRRIRDALATLSRRLGLPDPVKTGAIWGRWEELVGTDIAAHARPSSVRAGVLRVRADSPAWAQELQYLQEEIRARVNAGLGHQVVGEVRVYTGRPDPGRGGRAEPSPRSPKAPRGAPANPPPASPEEALERARRAWLRSREADPRAAPPDPPKSRK